jgi:hypothetical protein
MILSITLFGWQLTVTKDAAKHISVFYDKVTETSSFLSLIFYRQNSEPTILASERAKKVHPLDRSATVTGNRYYLILLELVS